MTIQMICLSLALSLPWTSMVQSQDAPPLPVQPPVGAGTAFQPGYDQHDLDIIVSRLRLDAVQRDLLETAYGEYITACEAGIDATRAAINSVAPGGSGKGRRSQVDRDAYRAALKSLIMDARAASAAAADPESRRQIMERYHSQVRDLQAQQAQEPGGGEEGRSLHAFMAEVQGILDAWMETRELLGETFFETIQAALREEQVVDVPGLRHALRRRSLLPLGRLSGESIDITGIIAAIRLSPESEEALQHVLLAWEYELDSVLQQREAFAARAQRAVVKIPQSGTGPVMAALRDRLQASVRIRDLSLQAAASIMELLPGEPGAAFRNHWYRVMYHDLGRPSHAGRLLSAAAADPDLPDDTRANIRAMTVRFHESLQARHRVIEGLILQCEPLRIEASIRQQYGHQETGSQPPDQLQVMLEDLRACELGMEEELSMLLGDAVFEDLLQAGYPGAE